MGQTQSQELQLKVLVVNSAAVFTFTIRSDADGQDLIAATTQQDPGYFGRHRIEIYSAKKADGSWLTVSEKQRQKIKRGLVPFEVFRVIHAMDSVDPLARLSTFGFPPADQLGDNEYHLLVQKLGVRIVAEPTWNDTTLPSPVLLEGQVFAVPRTSTVIELQKLHFSNYKQFQEATQPRTFVIPIADNITGIGKTMLAIHYIPWCCQMWPDAANRSAFQHELFYPTAPSPELLGGRISEALVKHSLVSAINDELEPGTEIDMAAALAMNLASLTKHLVETTWTCGSDARMA